MIQCVIFDCDGTLVDSEFLCNLALEIKLKDYNVDVDAHDLVKQYRGVKLDLILQAIETEYGITLADDFVPSYRVLVNELFDEKLTPCHGVNDMLTALNLPKCVASSGPLTKITKALTVTGLAHHFNQQIFSAYDIGSWKPDPGIFLYAAKTMGYSPHVCAVVEDSIVGITAAINAGMLPILYDPLDIHPVIEGVHTIKHMNQLQNIITR